ncbi:MAG: helix-turn-helix domain-containing protein [Fibromonadaceae bacterium]|jgi:transcriptional regulator with XRE-family HTH domain|nr:helix-turn-helix domain-containing protein [Fibromonadaceae bacterium]
MEAMETKDGIKKFRDKKRVNQTELADVLGINPGNVSTWEAGKGFPSFQIAKKLLEMDITVEELFGVEYEKKHFKNIKKEWYNSQKIILEAMIEELKDVIIKSGTEYANEYAKMLKAGDKIRKLHKEIEQADDEIKKEAKMQEYNEAIKLHEQSRRLVQDSQIQDLEEQMKAKKHSKASQIRTMINFRVAPQNHDPFGDEFPDEIKDYLP